jgi:hypothetical protein
VQRIGSKLGRVALGGRQPPDSPINLIDPNPSRIEHGFPIDHLSDRSRSRPSSPTPLGIEGHPRDAGVLDLE